MRFLAVWLLVFLASCGEGSGSPAVACASFNDSFGRPVTCAEMSALAGSDLAYLEPGIGGGDGGGDGGADGGAGDGAPIANTRLMFTDINGKSVTTTTDAAGYYRISLRGLKAPLVATVMRDNKPWKSMLVNDIVRAPANRNFYTINLTGLTDLVASKTALLDGLSGPDALTPAAVLRQKAQVPGVITDVNNSIAAKITAVGLDTATFNPLTTPFKAVASDSYDKLLESVVIVRNSAGQTVIDVTISTLAGVAGVGGSVNGAGTAATFNSPAGVAVDASGNVYVADVNNSLIRKITPAGVVSTLAGQAGITGSANGTGTAATFNVPSGVAVDASGNVYVADAGNSLIRKITPAGVVSTLAGQAGVTGSANGTGTAATFNSPAGVAVDSGGNVYVADVVNSVIRKITPAGGVSTLAGSGITGSANGTGTAASFNQPYGVAVDASGNVYVADTSNSLIRKITPAGVVSKLAGLAGITGSSNVGAATFNQPYGVAVDAAGSIYVTDSGNNLIRKITPAGVVSTLAGQAGVIGSANGIGTAATFNTPFGAAVDSNGNIYVGDRSNKLVRKIAP